MKHPNHHKSIHQHFEGAFRHRILLVTVLTCMFMAAASVDPRIRDMMRHAYAEGWGFIGTYLHHEHPSHQHASIVVARIPTVSGS